MSEYLDALRDTYEPEMVCPACQEQNSPTKRKIHIQNARGYTACDNCGFVGDVDRFLRHTERTDRC